VTTPTPKPRTTRRNYTVTPADHAALLAVGDGNASRGIRRLIALAAINEHR
jgi:hypothetical protein